MDYNDSKHKALSVNTPLEDKKMNQIMLAAVCRVIVGPTGQRIPAYGGIHAAYTRGLFADYFKYNPPVTDKTMYKYANCTTRFPHYFPRHYAGDSGYRRNLSDMMGIADACASITLLRQIQSDVHKWVTNHLPADVSQTLQQNYANHDVTRRAVAVYLADVMHYAICSDPQS